MDATHMHLMITHLPVFGSILGTFVLLFGLWRGSAGAKMSAYGLFVISALGAAISYATGEGAEETVEELPGVIESLISRHEDFAVYALISMIVLGVVSITAMLFNNFAGMMRRTTAIAALLLSMLSFGLIAKTAQLGGQIRHTEIRTGTAPNTGTDQPNGEHEQDDDE